MKKTRFAVLGGDLRFARLAEQLAAAGHPTAGYGFDALPPLAGVTAAPEPEAALAGAEAVVLPLPVSRRPGLLHAPLSEGVCTLMQVFRALPPGVPVLAGMPDRETVALARQAGAELLDYFQREELTVANAALTAEGAVQPLMERLPTALAGTQVLVVGFGRIGKLLARKLAALGARVTVSARRREDLAWIKALGYAGADTRALAGNLAPFRAVVGTVPAPVLGQAELASLRPGALVIDLASAPGCVDEAAARACPVPVIPAPGLPGICAPEAAAAALRDTILQMLLERGYLT